MLQGCEIINHTEKQTPPVWSPSLRTATTLQPVGSSRTVRGYCTLKESERERGRMGKQEGLEGA